MDYGQNRLKYICFLLLQTQAKSHTVADPSINNLENTALLSISEIKSMYFPLRIISFKDTFGGIIMEVKLQIIYIHKI